MKCVLGTELKINICVTGIDGANLEDCQFTVDFYVGTSKVRYYEAQMIKVDSNNYVAVLDTSLLKIGHVKAQIELNIPDNDCGDGNRKEILLCDTGIDIIAQYA